MIPIKRDVTLVLTCFSKPFICISKSNNHIMSFLVDNMAKVERDRRSVICDKYKYKYKYLFILHWFLKQRTLADSYIQYLQKQKLFKNRKKPLWMTILLLDALFWVGRSYRLRNDFIILQFYCWLFSSTKHCCWNMV